MRRTLLPLCLLLLAGAAPGPVYTLDVTDATAKVGEPATVTARLTLHDGYTVLQAYNHHVSALSTEDDSVRFAKKWVTAASTDGALVFKIDVSPLKPGAHPINGLLRFGYVDGPEGFSMISVPVVARVTGVE